MSIETSRFLSKLEPLVPYDPYIYIYIYIRMDLQEVGLGYEDWIGLAQDRNRWRALVSAVRNLRVP